MYSCGSTALLALIALGIGSSLLTYTCNKDNAKCGKFSRIVAYLIIAGSLVALLCSAHGAYRCHRGQHACSYSAHNAMTQGDDDKNCAKDMEKSCPMMKNEQTAADRTAKK